MGGQDEGKEIGERKEAPGEAACHLNNTLDTFNLPEHKRKVLMHRVQEAHMVPSLPRWRTVKTTCAEVRWRLNSKVVLTKKSGMDFKTTSRTLCV